MNNEFFGGTHVSFPKWERCNTKFRAKPRVEFLEKILNLFFMYLSLAKDSLFFSDTFNVSIESSSFNFGQKNNTNLKFYIFWKTQKLRFVFVLFAKIQNKSSQLIYWTHMKRTPVCCKECIKIISQKILPLIVVLNFESLYINE